jgi:hypothetical protein
MTPPCQCPGTSGALAAGPYTRTQLQLEEVRATKKEGTEVKRVNVNLEVSLHNSFKAATAAQGVDRPTVIVEFIQSYVARYGPAPKAKGRRA